MVWYGMVFMVIFHFFPVILSIIIIQYVHYTANKLIFIGHTYARVVSVDERVECVDDGVGIHFVPA